MTQEEALKVAKDWYNSRPDEQVDTICYLYEQKEECLSQMGKLTSRVQAIDTLICCLIGQKEPIPDVFLKAFEE